MNPLPTLPCKTVLLIGAGGSLASLAPVFVREGARVVIYCPDEAEAVAAVERIHTEGGMAAAVTGDLCDEEGARGVAEAALRAFGGIDLVVCGVRRCEEGTPGLDLRALDQLALTLLA